MVERTSAAGNNRAIDSTTRSAPPFWAKFSWKMPIVVTRFHPSCLACDSAMAVDELRLRRIRMLQQNAG